MAKTRLQQSFFPFEKPHYCSPAHCCQEVVAVALFDKRAFGQADFGEFVVEKGGKADHDSAEEIENNLVVDSSFSSKNESAEQQTRQEMIHGAGLGQIVQDFVSCFVGKYEKTQIESMLDCHGKDGFEDKWQFVKVDVFEQEGHDEGVYKPYFAAVLYSVAQSLEDS